MIVARLIVPVHLVISISILGSQLTAISLNSFSLTLYVFSPFYFYPPNVHTHYTHIHSIMVVTRNYVFSSTASVLLHLLLHFQIGKICIRRICHIKSLGGFWIFDMENNLLHSTWNEKWFRIPFYIIVVYYLRAEWVCFRV